ncbi:MSMEG_1061 family FMN-dependent PPOX-type flavoprotein [Nonomuraea rubra]|uniref:PPOX class probable FMN-dependent enzyme n=1 Tax=Nonomuraea rubra TaxID=46180 RepID=A0A7X0TZR3_9ACTN|nr:MSMEG_1061 family FMN-dependent PPOX-type flavoprotein [Nonomuraea rubra]MBB6549584.1 PPOX class probable FMN-dependent enzyme [Nonomuraea rubra]
MSRQNTPLADRPPASRRPREVSIEQVLARLGEPGAMAVHKIEDRLDEHTRRFIAHSPFLAMSTADAAGRADCSPRGDYPGFVKVLGERLLAIPDRPGNKLADSFRNLAENSGIGLLFLVPGSRETLRVNGRAYATDEPDVLARMQTEAREPELAIVVDVEEVYFHCGRALIRSRLWDPASQALAGELPTPGEMAVAKLGLDLDPRLVEASLEEGYRKLY